MRRLVPSLVLSAVLAAPAQAQPLRIGAPQPLSGPDAPFGEAFKRAYGMAIEEINAAGGVNGRKLEIVVEDHQAKDAVAAAVAERLISARRVLVMTGGRASGQAMEVASVCQRLRTPYLVDHPSADLITAKGFQWVFRQSPPGSIYPQAFLDFIDRHPGAIPRSVALVHDDTLFGRTIAAALTRQLAARDVPVVIEEAYAVNTADFRPAMTRVKRARPDYLLLVAVATTDAILLTRHAKEVGVHPRAYVGFGGGFAVAEYGALGPLADNVLSSAAWSGNPNDPRVKAFSETFHAKYGTWPHEHEVEAYSAIYVIADALRRAKLTGDLETDRDAVRQALLSTDVTTVLGRVKFRNWVGPLGDPYTNQNVYSPDHSAMAQWKDGHLLNVWPRECAEASLTFPDPLALK